MNKTNSESESNFLNILEGSNSPDMLPEENEDMNAYILKMFEEQLGLTDSNITEEKNRLKITYKDNGDFDSKMHAIKQHVEEYIGPVAHVLEEKTEAKESIAIIIVKPSAQKNYFTLVSCGLSEKSMNAVDPSDPEYYCELVICLPSNWHCPASYEEYTQADKKIKFPFHLLFQLIKVGLENRSFWMGNTISGNNIAGYPKIKALFLESPTMLSQSFTWIANESETQSIHFIGIYPILSGEYDFKIRHGSEALLKKLFEANVSLIFNPHRSSVLKNPIWTILKKIITFFFHI